MTARRTLDDWLQYIQTVHFRSIDMTLERVQSVLTRIADPCPFRVIAVAGTNGKGSCAAMLDTVLRACGRRTGLYTSPHLVRFNERIRVDGEEASDDELCRTFQLIDSRRGDVSLTYFEFATLAAVEVFRRTEVEVAVMEVGMGGRLDAVNALPVEAALITNVALDHMHWLGADREAIGGEKAPIMRAGRPAVFNHDDPPRSVLEYADRIGAPLLLRGRDYWCEMLADGWCWHGPHGETWRLPAPPIAGEAQVENAAGALALLAALDEPGFKRDTAELGLAKARLQARCAIVARDPMVMIDVAHNVAAVDTLAGQLQANAVAGRTTAVFGMLKDKEAAAVARLLDPLIDTWHLAGISDPRGQSAEQLADSICGSVRGTLHCHVHATEAFDAALEWAGPEDRIVAFGSFLIAGDILDHMKVAC